MAALASTLVGSRVEPPPKEKKGKSYLNVVVVHVLCHPAAAAAGIAHRASSLLPRKSFIRRHLDRNRLLYRNFHAYKLSVNSLHNAMLKYGSWIKKHTTTMRR